MQRQFIHNGDIFELNVNENRIVENLARYAKENKSGVCKAVYGAVNVKYVGPAPAPACNPPRWPLADEKG
jgi:hypothetical protein